MFSPYIVFLAAIAGLLATINAVPANAPLKPEPVPTTKKPVKPAPPTCTTTYFDTAHSTEWTGVHLCYTHTVTAPAGVPAVHQGVEHDGAVLDELLPDDADDHCVERRVRNMRPLPHPDGMDHVHDGLPRHAYHYLRGI
ncbi:hypothetical protein DL769_001886 [Monosporascus sp. CRB-8-3]|nr:hypothetical protein DL769_001886 [Monosporascus sp. CRB-8-3]